MARNLILSQCRTSSLTSDPQDRGVGPDGGGPLRPHGRPGPRVHREADRAGVGAEGAFQR